MLWQPCEGWRRGAPTMALSAVPDRDREEMRRLCSWSRLARLWWLRRRCSKASFAAACRMLPVPSCASSARGCAGCTAGFNECHRLLQRCAGCSCQVQWEVLIYLLVSPIWKHAGAGFICTCTRTALAMSPALLCVFACNIVATYAEAKRGGRARRDVLLKMSHPAHEPQPLG